MNAIFTSRLLPVDAISKASLLRAVRSLLGFSPATKASRIVRRPHRSYEEFIFKGYHVEKQGPAGSGAFKAFRFLWKN